MNSRIAAAIALMLCSVCPSVRADVWTLDRVITQAVGVSNTAEIERLDSRSAGLDAELADRSRLPVVSIGSGVNFFSEKAEISLPGRTITMSDYDRYDVNIGFNQLLYDGGRLRALGEASRERSRMNDCRADAALLAVEYTAKTAFFGAANAETMLKASEQSVTEAQNHLDDVIARKRQGMVLETDVLRAKLRVSQAEMDRESRSADREKAQAVLREVLALEPGESLALEWNTDAIPSGPDATLESVVSSRPEFGAYDAAIASSVKTAEQARADLRPMVSFYGKFNYGKPGVNQPANDWMHYFSGGVALSWNIWDWGIASRREEKAMIEAKKTERRRDDFRRHLARELTEAHASLDAAVKRYDLAVESERFAERQLELVTASYRQGMATETDYDSAHNDFTTSALDKSAASTTVRIIMAHIEYVLGITYTGGNR